MAVSGGEEVTVSCLRTWTGTLLAIALALAPLRAVAVEISLGTEDVTLPPGYVIEPVVTGLTFPSSLAFGPDGSLYIAEAGHSYGAHWAEARVLRLRPDGQMGAIASGFRGPIMGLTFRDNLLYVAHRGMVSVVDLSRPNPSRHVRDIVTGLPVLPNSSHFNSEVAFGPDGKMYFGVGTVTNSGVPGLDDLLFGWLPDFPWMHDAPARDLTLTGENYRSLDVLGPDPLGKPSFVRGGAFLPFGTRSRPGQVIPAHRMPTGAVYRANPDGSELEVYAWGIRSPFGFRFGPDGRLYMTNHAVDDKGARPAYDVPDALFVIRQNAFYGWPDFLAGIPITDARFDPKLVGAPHPGFVLRDPPPVEQPAVRFVPHAADMKFDWSRSDRFGSPGEMFMAEFGDGSPLNTALKSISPRGYRIIRVNPTAGTFEDFMSVRNPGLETTRGPKRPLDVKFDPSGESLYLLDFGVMTVRVALDQIGINPLAHTGTLWRIRRQGGAAPAPARPVVRVQGSKLISWWTVRTMVLGIQKDIQVALAHARLARSSNEAQHSGHLEETRGFLDSVRTRVTLALKRIDEPDVIDNGTRIMLVGVRDWAAGRNLHNPLALSEEDPVIREVNEWVERNSFPEKEYLRQNYALPGRWQRPVEEDIHP